MTSKELRDRINSMCSHVLFDYHGKECGVDPFNEKHFDMWCGKDYMEAHSIDEVMNSPFFEGKTLEDIIDQLENFELKPTSQKRPVVFLYLFSEIAPAQIQGGRT